MTTALTQGLERIPDQLGYLVISEDGVLAVRADTGANTGANTGATRSDFYTTPEYTVTSHFLTLNILLFSRLHPFPQSAGEMENDEHTAGIIMQLVRTGCSVSSAEPPFKRMSVICEEFAYTVTVSGQKVFVVKRQNNQREPVIV